MQHPKGTVLYFDEASYRQSVSNYTPILSKINEVGKAYEALDTTFKFSQEVYDGILKGGTRNVEKQYAERIEAQLEQSKFTSQALVKQARENSKIDLTELSAAIEAMHKAFDQANMYTGSSIPADLYNIRIIEGKADLSNDFIEALKDQLTNKIRTDEEAEIYEKMVGLKSAFEEFTGFMEAKGFRFAEWAIIGNGHLVMQDGGKLIINHGALSIIENVRRMSIQFQDSRKYQAPKVKKVQPVN